MTHEDFIIKLNTIVPNRKYAILSKYKKAKSKIYIQDTFGLLLVDVRTLYRGTTEFNVRSAVNKTDYICNKFISIHKNRYDYSLVEYKNDSSNIKIICPKHGVFEQKVNTHLANKGCPKCAKLYISKQKSENPTGWSCSDWKKAASISENFDSFKVYIVKLYNNEEEFYKIGRTYRTTGDRLKIIPYKYKLIKEYIDTPENIIRLEGKLHKLNNKFKYFPKKFFKGQNECFSKYLTL